MKNKASGLTVLSLIMAVFLCACEAKEIINPAIFVKDDLVMAKEAHLKRDWPLAERLLGRYLRDEEDPELRWEAWTLLLETLNAGSQEPRASMECLEVMLVEYEDDEARLTEILSQMGKLCESLKHYDRAANAWSAYSDLAVLPVEKRAYGLRRLAQAQLAQRYFDAAVDTLQECLALPLADRDKAWCMIDLADASAGREQWQDVADLCQQIIETSPSDEVFGLAAYLRGDALEQMGDIGAALAQFEQGRDKYPNPAVMENRIEWLKKQLKAKK